MIDLRARVALLRLEIYDRAGDPRGERARELAEAASAALGELPAEHSLRPRLSLELEAR